MASESNASGNLGLRLWPTHVMASNFGHCAHTHTAGSVAVTWLARAASGQRKMYGLISALSTAGCSPFSLAQHIKLAGLDTHAALEENAGLPREDADLLVGLQQLHALATHQACADIWDLHITQ